MSEAILRQYAFTGLTETNFLVQTTAVTDVTNPSMFGLTLCVCTAVQTLRTFTIS